MIRVRFAPSPTGFLHIGGLRTCFYNYLFAKKNKGKLILRIEDTDRERYVENATESLIRTLQVIGLDYDEGPFVCQRQTQNKKLKIKNKKYFKEEFIIDQKGKYGPYIQSQRIGLYQNLAQKLVDDGFAYYCFCTKEELEKSKEEQIAQKKPPVYDGRCRKLTREEITLRLHSLQQSSGHTGQPYVIRLKVPEKAPESLKGSERGSPPSPGGLRRTSIKFNDLIRGEVEFDLQNIDDQILLKSDGWPTYHLANVIDDHLMNITHVIRGEEWLPSVPKHLLIYWAFGWRIPQFAHLPLLLNPDRSKLSKRQGDVAVEEYLGKGYLPEALLNFIALLGWNPGTDQEIFNLKELTKQFSLEKIQKAGAIFNINKLDWFNGYYIRQKSLNDLTRLCISYLIEAGLIKPVFIGKQYPPAYGGYSLEQKYIISKPNEEISYEKIKKIVALERERLKRLNEIGEKTKFFFIDKLEYNQELLFWQKMNKEEIVENLNLIKKKLEALPDREFTKNKIQKSLDELAKEKGTGEIFWPFRVALTGQKASPPPAEIAEILGREKTIKRINDGIGIIMQIK